MYVVKLLGEHVELSGNFPLHQIACDGGELHLKFAMEEHVNFGMTRTRSNRHVRSESRTSPEVPAYINMCTQP
jgi:hypothetical protein